MAKQLIDGAVNPTGAVSVINFKGKTVSASVYYQIALPMSAITVLLFFSPDDILYQINGPNTFCMYYIYIYIYIYSIAVPRLAQVAKSH